MKRSHVSSLHSAACTLLAGLLAACSTAPSPWIGRGVAAPRLGALMPAGSSTLAVVHKGRRLCAHQIEVARVRYSFDVECGSTIVVHAQTADPRFQAPEGLAIGDSLGRAAAAEGGKLGIFGGGCGVSLPSGWIARAGPGPGDGEEACKALLSEPIERFETLFLDRRRDTAANERP